MKAKYAGPPSAIFSSKSSSAYVIFSGTYDPGSGAVTQIRVQADDDRVCICDSKMFDIANLDFSGYVFSEDGKLFSVDCISYENFWEMFYEDRIEKIENYVKAKKDFEAAKGRLYEELTFDELSEKLLNGTSDERDFVFRWLGRRNDSRFIKTAMNLIDKEMRLNAKNYSVEEIFRYLAQFRSDEIQSFFFEYSAICDRLDWDSEIILNYLYPE